MVGYNKRQVFTHFINTREQLLHLSYDFSADGNRLHQNLKSYILFKSNSFLEKIQQIRSILPKIPTFNPHPNEKVKSAGCMNKLELIQVLIDPTDLSRSEAAVVVDIAYVGGRNLDLLEPGVAKAFPTQKAVNKALLSLIMRAKIILGNLRWENRSEDGNRCACST